MPVDRRAGEKVWNSSKPELQPEDQPKVENDFWHENSANVGELVVCAPVGCEYPTLLIFRPFAPSQRIDGN
jgi:hypothetical protein